MKRLFVVLLAVVALASCGKSERLGPKETVVECWTRINNGDYQGAVSLMEGTEEEKIEYVTLLENKYAAKLQKAGGVQRVDVLADDCGDKEAVVQAIVVLGNGGQIVENYLLKRVDKEWILQGYKVE